MWIGSQHKLVIHWVWPFIASPMGFPVFGSHTRTCPSCPPVASFRSRASHSTQRTHPLCPERMCEGVSVSRSHNRAFVSPDPVASRFPVGENAAQRMGELWPARSRVLNIHDTRGTLGEKKDTPDNVEEHLVAGRTRKTA